MKTYAVLYAPEFRLQATLRHSSDLIDRPACLLDSRGVKSLIVELNESARAHHVECGMTPTQALARCPDLVILTGNAGHERTAADIILQTAETLSPFVEATAPGVVTVELPGERIFTQGELIQKVVTPLTSSGLEVRVGVANTPDLARLGARFARPVEIVESAATFLAPLPVDALEPSNEILTVLKSWGIHTIHQLVRLPMAEVCERLGPDAVSLRERAAGGKPRPLKLIKPLEFFAERADLENAVEMLEPLLFLLRRFIENISARLANAYLVAAKLRLVLVFEKGDPYTHVFTIPQPTRDVTLLFRMLHSHLENFSSEWPIIELELAAKPVRPGAEQWSLLEPGLRNPHGFSETLARLSALLGSDRVGSAVVDASHHPDAFHISPYEMDILPPDRDDHWLIGVPLSKFRPPIRAKVILNEMRPGFLYSDRCTGQIRETCGPWIVEGDWWESRRWRREEWDVDTDDGAFRLIHVENDWFIDGVYA